MKDNEIWHNRLGHINYDSLGKLNSQEIVRGLPNIKLISNIVCRPCQEGKIVKSAHKKTKDILTSKPLEFIHMDLMGPSVSLCDNSYILVMVDDFTRFT